MSIQVKSFGRMLLAAILGSLFTFAVVSLFDSNESSIRFVKQDPVPANHTLFTLNEEGEAIPLDFTGTSEKVTESVVHILNTSVTQRQSPHGNIPEEFRDFFGPFNRDGSGRPQMSTGSGVIISEDGYIVTNNHVIDNADELEVTLNDNRKFKAKVIGADPTTDIALVKIDTKGLPFLSFTDSEKIRVGEWVLAVGNPYNLNSTVTAGIISAKARSIGIISSPNSETRANEGIEAFIQTDAAVNPGNSGGALVNLNGDLIGINTAIASRTGSYTGYSFAVPSNIVSKVVEDLIKYGTVQRGWLGVVITSVSDELAKQEDLEVITGAYISEMAENSGAKDAGIEKGDVIVDIDGRKMKTNTDVIGYVGQHRPGDKIKVTVNRFGKEKTFDVTLKNRQGNTEFVEKEVTLFSKLGAEFEEVDRKTLKRLELDHGVRVTKLSNGLLRRETNMREGFIITGIAGKPVTSAEDIEKIISEATGGVLIEGRYEDYSKTEYYALGVN